MGQIAELLKSGNLSMVAPDQGLDQEPEIAYPETPQKSLLQKIYFWSGLQGLEQISRVPGQMGKGAILETIQEGDSISSILKGYAKGAVRSLSGDFITRKEIQTAGGEIREEGVSDTLKDIAFDMVDDSYLYLMGVGQAKAAAQAPALAKALQKAAIRNFTPEIKGLGVLEFVKGGLPVQTVLGQAKETQALYRDTLKLKRFQALWENHLNKTIDTAFLNGGIYNKKGVANPELVEEFLYFAQHSHEMSPEEMARISGPVKQCALEIQTRIFDTLHTYAKKTAPDLGYWVGFFPHYAAIGEGTKEWKAIESAKKMLPEISNMYDLINRQKTMRGTGGYFSSIDQKRILSERENYSKALKDVTKYYVRGVLNKGFKDRWKPLVVDTVDALTKQANAATKGNQAKYESLIDYVWGSKEGKGTSFYDVVTGQAEIDKNIKWRAAFANSGIPGLRNMEKPASQITDFITGFNYITKLGLSYVRFPLVNLTQPLLTTLPAAGTKAFYHGFLKAITGNKEYMELARDHGVYSSVSRAVSERGVITSSWEKYAAIPQQASETWNRWLTFCVGMESAKFKNLSMTAVETIKKYKLGGKAGVLEEALSESPKVQHALDLVDLCQFPYFRHTMPQWASTSGFKKIAMQFRSFSSFYLQYLMQMKQRGPVEFSKAMGSLVALSGMGFIPYYNYIKEEGLRIGVDLPEINIIKDVTKAAGIPGGITIGSSLEPFNPPQKTSWLLGPTWGPLAEAFFPGEGDIGKVLEGISPPISRAARYLIDKQVYTDAEKARYLGDRSIVEALYLKPSLESRRYKILSRLEAAVQGGREDIVQECLMEAKEEGIQLELFSPSGHAGKDMATINSRITKRMRMYRGKTEAVIKKALENLK